MTKALTKSQYPKSLWNKSNRFPYKKHLLLPLFLLCLYPPFSFSAEYTGTHKIKTIELDAATSKMYFTNTANQGWGASGCPNASYVLLDPSLTDLSTSKSLGITAYATQTDVRFYGSCDPSSTHNFIATSMTLF